MALAGTDPIEMLAAPIPASKYVLEKAGLTIDDIVCLLYS
jgi:acetyl-CoA C-acetyltransferase